MGERLIPKLDRIGAEAGIKQMTPEMYNFAMLVRADVVSQWPERPWVGLTDEEIKCIEETTTCSGNESWLRNLTRSLEAKLKEKNT
jgi:hypothetical protein